MARWFKLPNAPAILRDRRGSTAAEFALILGPLIALTLGAINLCLMIYTVSTLHFAVQDTARCLSVKKTVCTNVATAQAYAASVYKGPGVAVTFTPAAEACGNRVTGTADFTFTTGLTSTVFPLSTTACYPLT